MCRVVSEEEFAVEIRKRLVAVDGLVACVVGPGRSGAVAAVYASHILGVPYLPFGGRVRDGLPRLLIIDTATETGKTMRRAVRFYAKHLRSTPLQIAVYAEPPRVMFWYEAGKPQRFRHEPPLRP